MTAREAMVEVQDHFNLCPECRAMIDHERGGIRYGDMCQRAKDLIDLAYEKFVQQ